MLTGSFFIGGYMRCAVIDAQGIVVNIIMADPSVDVPPENCTIYEILGDVWIDIGMNWNDRIVVIPQEPTPEEPEST